MQKKGTRPIAQDTEVSGVLVAQNAGQTLAQRPGGRNVNTTLCCWNRWPGRLNKTTHATLMSIEHPCPALFWFTFRTMHALEQETDLHNWLSHLSYWSLVATGSGRRAWEHQEAAEHVFIFPPKSSSLQNRGSSELFLKLIWGTKLAKVCSFFFFFCSKPQKRSKNLYPLVCNF